MVTPIPPPRDSQDYTHIGNYQGPMGHHFTTGSNYNLIYEQRNDTVSARNDVGEWYQLDGSYFDVTHNYDTDDAVPDMPMAGNAAAGAAAPVPVMHDDDLDCEAWVEDCDTPWTDQFGEDPIPEGPESTADLRQYRYTPDTY